MSTEGKTDVETVRRRVTRIQELQEALREEALKNTTVPEKPDLSQVVLHCSHKILYFTDD